MVVCSLSPEDFARVAVLTLLLTTRPIGSPKAYQEARAHVDVFLRHTYRRLGRGLLEMDGFK